MGRKRFVRGSVTIALALAVVGAAVAPSGAAVAPSPAWADTGFSQLPVDIGVRPDGSAVTLGASNSDGQSSDSATFDERDTDGHVGPFDLIGFFPRNLHGAFDAAGNVYVAGRYLLDFPVVNVASLTKFAPDHTVLWRADYPEDPFVPTAFRGVALGLDGAVVAAVRTYSNGVWTTSIDRYTASGTKLWSRHPVDALDIAIDGAGCIYVQVSPVRVIAYDRRGRPLWDRTIGAQYPTVITRLAGAPAGGVYLAGTQDRGTGLLRPVLRALDVDGHERWRTTLAGAGSDTLVAAAQSGELAVAWARPNRANRTVVARLDPVTGATAWSAVVPGSYNGVPTVVATTATRIVVGGRYYYEGLFGNYGFEAAYDG